MAFTMRAIIVASRVTYACESFALIATTILAKIRGTKQPPFLLNIAGVASPREQEGISDE